MPCAKVKNYDVHSPPSRMTADKSTARCRHMYTYLYPRVVRINGQSPYWTQCLELLRSTFGSEAPSERTVCNWFAGFRCGRTSANGEFRENRPKSVVPKNIDVVRNMKRISIIGHVVALVWRIEEQLMLT